MSWPPHAAVGAAVGFQEAFELLRYLDYEIVSNALVLTFGSRYRIPCRLLRATSGVSLVGSLLNRYVYIERVTLPNSIKQRSQLWRRGRLRPRPPKAPQHNPRVQPASHLPQSYRPRQLKTLLLGFLFFFPPPPPLRAERLVAAL